MHHLAHFDSRTREVLERTVAALASGYGSDLIGVFLYGSATGPDFIPGRSDLNLLILLAKVRVPALDAARALAGRWRRDRITPLILTVADLHASLDVFPIEIMEIKASRIVLFGQDPFDGVSVQLGHLRLQCERDLKRHLVRFRHAYLGLGRGTRELEHLLAEAVTGLLPVLRTLARVAPAEEPADRGGREAVITEVARRLGFEPAPLLDALEIKRGARRSAVELRGLVDAYLAQIERLVDVVDRLKLEGHWV
jgi:hypothetical protein